MENTLQPQALSISVLGDLEVRVDGQLKELPPSKKTRALLAYLMMVEKPVRRERLCEIFWEIPDDPRASLRWSLSKLRPIVNGDGVERLKANRNVVEFQPIDCDIDGLLLKAAAHRNVSLDRAEERDSLSALAGRKGFIEDLPLANAPVYEAWRTAMADEIAAMQSELKLHLANSHPSGQTSPTEEPYSREGSKETDKAPAIAQFAPAARAPHASLQSDQTVMPERCIISAMAIDIRADFLNGSEDEPEALLDKLDPIVDLVFSAIEEHNGEVMSASGAHFLAVFSERAGSENHSHLACRCALKIAALLADHFGSRVGAAIAIDRGLAIVRQQRRQIGQGVVYSGQVCGEASRYARDLSATRVLLAANVLPHIKGFFDVMPLEAEQEPLLGGDPGLLQLQSESDVVSRWHVQSHRHLTGFVGRELELSMLETALHRTRSGQGSAIGVVGDPGFGKSRLVHEFVVNQLKDAMSVFEASVLEFDRQVPFQLCRRMLITLCDISPDAPLEEKEKTLFEVLTRLDLMTLSNELRSLLSPPDRAQQETVFKVAIITAMVGLVSRLASEGPFAFVLEDLHWCDDESVEFLNELVQILPVQPCLIIATYRPEFTNRWTSFRSIQELRLLPLDESESRKLVENLVGSNKSTEDLSTEVLRVAEGVPLFLEEMIREVEQTGALRGDPGDYQFVYLDHTLAIPENILSVIGSRISRLAPVERRVLQMAAVCGKVFPESQLSSIAQMSAEELHKALDTLRNADFVYELQRFPETIHTFKHALIHDVAYEQMLQADRRSLHEAVLSSLKSLDKNEEQIEQLAHHAFRAENWEKAARYGYRAALKSVDLSAYGSAENYCEDVLHALRHLPKSEEWIGLGIDVRLELRPIYTATGSLENAESCLQEARELCEKTKDDERLMEVLLNSSFLKSTFAKFREAQVFADELAKHAGATKAKRFVIEAKMAKAQSYLMQSQPLPALELLDEIESFYTTEWRGERFGYMTTRSVWYYMQRCLGLSLIGDFDGALAATDAAREIANETGRIFDLFDVDYFSARMLLIKGADETLVESLDRIIDQKGYEKDLKPFNSWMLMCFGQALYVTGEFDRAIDVLDDAIYEARRYQMKMTAGYAQVFRFLAYLAKDDLATLEASLNDILQLVEPLDDPWVKSVLLREFGQRTGGSEGQRLISEALDLASQYGLAPEKTRAEALLSGD